MKTKRLMKMMKFGGYPIEVLLAIDATDDQLRRYIQRRLERELFPEEIEALSISSCLGRTSRLAGGLIVLRLHYLNRTPESMATLAHEIYHAVCLMMAFIGAKQSDDSDEAYAYAIQDLTAQALALVKS